MRAWLKIVYNDKLNGFLPIYRDDDQSNQEDSMVQLPWSKRGEPALLLRCGHTVMVDTKDIVFSATRPQVDKDGSIITT